MAKGNTYNMAFALNAKMSSSFNKSFNQASKQINSLANTAKVAMGTILGVVGVSSTVGTAFGEAMNLEGYKMQLETATKSAEKAGEIMKWSVDLANRTPFETGSVVEASARLEAMGMSAQKFLPMIGDMAGATNKDLIQATEAIIDAQTGELERLKEFGIKKSDIIQYAYDKMGQIQVVNNKGQITNQDKFNEAMLALMDDKFKGGMEKQASTMKGLMSTVSGIIKSGMATAVGMTKDGTIKQGSLFDTLKGKVKQVADTLVKWQENGTFEKIGDMVSQVISDVSTSISFLVDAFSGNVDSSTWNGMVGILEKLGLSSEEATQTTQLLNDVIGTTKDTIGYLLDKAGELYRFIIGNWTQIEPIVVGIGLGFTGWKIGSVVYDVVSSCTKFYKSLMKVTSWLKITTFTQLGLAKAKLIDKAETLYLKALYAGDFLKSLLIQGKTIAANALAWGINTAQMVAQKAGLLALKGVQLISQGVTMAMTAAQWALNAAFIASPIGWVVLGIGALIAIGVLLWKNWDVIKVKAFELWEGIKSAFGGMGEWFGGVWDGIKSTFKGFINFVIGGLNKIPEALNSLNFTVPDWVPGLGGKSIGFKLPMIPQFAKGTMNTPKGAFIAGEKGPELISGAPGRKVFTAQKTKSIFSNTQNISSTVKDKEATKIQMQFSPQVYVQSSDSDVETKVQRAIAEAKREFMKEVKTLLKGKGRLAFE